MTPFHEINPISYQEFLDIIQKETGLQSFRGRASRRGYGNLPSVDNTHYREPTFLSFNIVEHPTKRLDSLRNDQLTGKRLFFLDAIVWFVRNEPRSCGTSSAAEFKLPRG